MRKKRPKKSIDANLLIINFDNKIEESVDMKDRAINTYTSDQTVSIALWIITNKGLFVKDIRVWKKKDTVEKNGTSSKTTSRSPIRSTTSLNLIQKSQGNRQYMW